MSPNLKTQEQLKSDLEKFHEQEKALRLLGWFEVSGLWWPPIQSADCIPCLFDTACKRAGLK